MAQTLGRRCRTFLGNASNLKVAWMLTAAMAASYVALIRPYQNSFSINNQRAAGLASVDKAETLAFYSTPMFQKGVVGGVPRSPGYLRNAVRVRASLSTLPVVNREQSESEGESDRKMVRTNTLDLVVLRPSESAEKIRALAEQNGGFLVSSEVRGGPDATVANLAIRVPVARYEQVRNAIRTLGLRVEAERVEAQDVTRQYTDQDANLRNLKAEEQQYLQILKQAKTVKDTLDVSEKLSEVRGQIEQQQAEFNALSKQIETVLLNVSLRSEAEARVMGLNWRPLYQIKMAVRDGLDGLANYLSTMTSVLFFLPTVILWMATIILAGLVAWKILRWIAHRWFGWKRAEPAQA